MLRNIRFISPSGITCCVCVCACVCVCVCAVWCCVRVCVSMYILGENAAKCTCMYIYVRVERTYILVL